MKISHEEIKHIGKLSRIAIDDSDLDMYADEMTKVVDFVDKLNEINTEGVKPTIGVLDLINVFREDEVIESIDREDALKNAAEKNEEFFVAPKII